LDTLHVQAVSRIDPNLPATTRSIQLLTAEEISSLPVRTIAEMLEWATGVEVLNRSPAQSDLSIRGAGFEQVVVLVNGVRMSDPQTGHFDLDLTAPLESVERVEVIRGAASALYGADAMGGVVNVVTRSSGAPFAVSVRGGSWNTIQVSARTGVGVGMEGDEEAFSLNAGGEASRSDGHRVGTDYETLLFHGSLSHRLGGGRVTGDFGASRRDFGAQDFYAPYPSFEKTRTQTASVGWKTVGSRSLGLDVRMSARRHKDDFVLIRDDPSQYQNQHESTQLGGLVLGRYVAGVGLDVAVGGELFWDGLTSSNLGNHSERRGAMFAEALVGGIGSAVMSMGLRTDWHEGFGAFVSPSVSASLTPNENARIRAALGRSFRAPTWTERYYRDPVNVGQPDLQPERAWSGELGLDLFPRLGLNISTTLFIRRATSLIDWARLEAAPDTDPWETRNVEDATFKGVEADIQFSGPLSIRWTIGGTALTVDANEASGYRSKYALRPLREQLTLGAERFFGSAASVRIRMRHGRRKNEDSYRRVDLRLNVWAGVGWLRLDVNNLTGFDYPDVTGARAPGRSFFVGYSLGRD
jgi:iron complex outermembrane receptor protein